MTASPTFAEHTEKFQLDGKWYTTNEETLKVLSIAINSYRIGGSTDVSAIACVMSWGLKAGVIADVTA